MALDPNEELPNLTGFVEDPELWPERLPTGVTKDAATWYAHKRTFRDGRVVWEFFKRGSGGGANGEGDAVAATATTENKSVKEKWEKDDKEAQEAAQKPPEERNNNGRRERWNPQTSRWDDVGPAINATATPSTTESKPPETKDEGGRRYQWQPNPGGPNAGGQWVDVGPAPENAQERQAREAQEARARQAQQDARQRQIDAQSAATRASQERRAEATERRQESAEQRAAEKDAFGVEPEGAPAFNPSPGQITQGVRRYSEWLSAQVKLHKDTNGAQGVSPAEATKLMNRRIDLAEKAVAEQTSLASGQKGLLDNATTQRGQTIGDTQSRRNMAQTVAADINARGDQRLKYLLPENAADHVAARQEELQNALAYASQWGGLRESPEVSPDSFPALAAMRQASMAGIQTAAGGGPVIFDARAPTPPPAGAAAASMPAPAFMPPPPVTGSVAAPSAPMVPPAANPIDGSPVVLPNQLPGASSAPPVRDGWQTPGTGDLGTDLGQPGDPRMPVTGIPAGGNVQMAPSPRFMQETRFGQGNYFDPDLAGADLSLRLGIDPEIMRQARANLYG